MSEDTTDGYPLSNPLPDNPGTPDNIHTKL